jgi:predicted Zn-dependent protease
MEDRRNEALKTFEEAQSALEAGNLDLARDLLESLDYSILEQIEVDDALAARVLALQLCILQERYGDALYHADAALDLAAHEPLVHHLAGQAMWAQKHYRTAAEMLIYAAELLEGLHEEVEPFHFKVDQAQVFYMAAEACRTFEQESAAEHFYQMALEHTRELSAVESKST